MKKLLLTGFMGVLLTGALYYSETLVAQSIKLKTPKSFSQDRALFNAALNGNAKDIEKALKAGANINAFDEKRYGTALMITARNGHNEAVKMLIAAGANVNAVIWIGKLETSDRRIPESHPSSVLDQACNHPEIIKTLIEAGAVSGYRAGYPCLCFYYDANNVVGTTIA